MTKNLRKTIAFTLAETLIVMGIIGVVSALTLPNLNSSTGEKEKVAKVKKLYQNLTDAYGRAVAIYGPFEQWFINDTTAEAKAKRFGERMTEFMKVSKNCGNSAGCFSSDKFLYYDGTDWNSNYLSFLQQNKAQMYILADGTSILFFQNNIIKIDIDGPNKGKNQEGFDSFTFEIDNNNGLVPRLRTDGSGTFSQIGNHYDVTTWVIMNDNMDYLKCEDKLNWQTKTSCK